MPLEKERETYERELESLLAHHAGKYVVIAGEEIIGHFTDYEDALQAGYERVGVKPFLVKRIESVERLHHFTRDIIAECPTCDRPSQ